jgi:hypothetical protein
MQSEVLQFLTSTLAHFDRFSFDGLHNVLAFAKKLFLATASNAKMQREIVKRLLDSTSSGLVRRCALTGSPKIWEASTDMFRTLLNSKV